MARSLSALSKRRKTIKTTQKITNAMKLVSISKLQRYRMMLQDFMPAYSFITGLPSEDCDSEKDILYIAFAPDLGLASTYTRELIRFIEKLDRPKLLYIGTQAYEDAKVYGTVLNDKISGEHMDVESLVDLCRSYRKDYQIRIVMGESQLSAGIQFYEVNSSRKLKKGYQQLFEPKYESVNDTYQDMLVKAMILNGYTSCKMSEYMLRRIAMEKASENAEKILEDLKLQYNRLRQERITEELADLVAAESEAR